MASITIKPNPLRARIEYGQSRVLVELDPNLPLWDSLRMATFEIDAAITQLKKRKLAITKAMQDATRTS